MLSEIHIRLDAHYRKINFLNMVLGTGHLIKICKEKLEAAQWGITKVENHPNTDIKKD